MKLKKYDAGQSMCLDYTYTCNSSAFLSLKYQIMTSNEYNNIATMKDLRSDWNEPMNDARWRTSLGKHSGTHIAQDALNTM